jgi:transposase
MYCYLPPTDMRKSIDTLCLLIADVLKMNPTEGYLFLFRSRDKSKLKALYYEPNCFTLWYRRLERGRFIFPKNQEGAIEMSDEHFHWLLASDKYTQLEVRDKKYEKFI